VGSASAGWQHYWKLHMYRVKPSYVRRIPKALDYRRVYVPEMAYVEPPKQCESPRAFRHSLPDTAHDSNGGKQAQGHAHYAAPPDDRLGQSIDEPTWDFGDGRH
jgi:hypothetical protein